MTLTDFGDEIEALSLQQSVRGPPAATPSLPADVVGGARDARRRRAKWFVVRFPTTMGS